MISPRALVEEVSNYLVDQDPDFPFEHWTEDDLLHYFRLAVEIVANTQREKFIKRTSMPLVAGSLQTIPEACHDVSSVLGQADSKGRVRMYTLLRGISAAVLMKSSSTAAPTTSVWPALSTKNLSLIHI